MPPTSPSARATCAGGGGRRHPYRPTCRMLPSLTLLLFVVVVVFCSLLYAPAALAAPTSSSPATKEAPEDAVVESRRRGEAGGWVDPRSHGGSMLDLVGNGYREPINVIISGRSDPQVLSDDGLRDYVRTIGFSFECLDLHLGRLQRADLGDGRGFVAEQYEFRQTAGRADPGRWVGACWESFSGGNHFRAWKQNGTLANTGAWFLAVSKEKNLRHHHTIEADGYNVGRDLLVEAAERGGRWRIWKWRADVEWVEGLLDPGAHGINHHIAQDGRVAVLTVDRVIGIPFLDSVVSRLPVGFYAGPRGAWRRVASVLGWAGV